MSMRRMHKIVVKVGTSTLTAGTQKLSRRSMLSLVQQIVHLKDKGVDIVLVSSGAVATGRELMSLAQGPSRQTYASIGQAKLMQVWSELFSLYDQHVGQVLVTKENFFSQNHLATCASLSCLLKHSVLPVVNENDTTATPAGRIGNNDTIATLVAQVIGADTVIFLTDQEGLYTADPRSNPEAKLISCVHPSDVDLLSQATSSGTSLGTGGMRTKIEAALLAVNTGMQAIITSLFQPDILIQLASGTHLGTLFCKEE